MPQPWQPPSKGRHFDASGYLSEKTIAALCSPTGGAITVLRISGRDALKIAKELTQKTNFEHRKAQREWIFTRDGKKLDDVVALPFFSPHSFTGEDVVEFFLHGSPIVAQKVLDEIFARGARLALPGEFSFRAVKNGKMMLSQAEAVKELIQADNDFALDLALEKLSGSQHELVTHIKNELMQLVTLSEAGIDFSDQDLDEVSLPRLKERLKELTRSIEELRGSFDRGKRFLDGIPVTIFGLPNAGKSSFFNALLGEDRSIVSDIAGTTRDVVREKINLKGEDGYVSLKVSDTAGLRKSGDQIESIGIERTIKAAQESDLIIVVVDGLNPEIAAIEKQLNRIDRTQKSVIAVISKKDLVDEIGRKSLENEVKKLSPEIVFWISSTTLEGVTEAAREIAKTASKKLSRKPGEVILTQVEHVHAVTKALEGFARAHDVTDIVLFATEVRHAMNELGPLTGETIPDDILGKIFSDFCIGK